MKHRNLLICVAVLLSMAAASAAPRHSRYSYFNGIGLTFGYANSSYRTLDLATDEPTTSAMLHGFTLGITKDFTLLPSALYFQTGLNYVYQNDSRNETLDILKVKLVGDREEHYIALPVRLKYQLDLTDVVGVTFDAGPTMLMGLSSKFNYRTRFADDTVLSSSYNIYNGKVKSSGSSLLFDLTEWMDKSGMYPHGNLRRFDVMLGASVGADLFDVLEFRLGYDWGLINRYKKAVAEQYKLTRGQFTLSVGLRF